MIPTPCIALLTDFGTADHYVGCMKAAIAAALPGAVVIDVSHEVRPHDIAHGAFLLRLAFPDFPAGTIFVAVVDPGVGTARQAILVKSCNRFFVGPDNGLFTFVYATDPVATTYTLEHIRTPECDVSSTFHGRDIFAPAAAALASGREPSDFGRRVSVEELMTLPILPAKYEGTAQGVVMHCDRFGNMITNIHRRDLSDVEAGEAVAAGHRLPLVETYAASKEPLFALWGSSGFLEIAARESSAAAQFSDPIGTLVALTQTGPPVEPRSRI